jgi:hypothetical protein
LLSTITDPTTAAAPERGRHGPFPARTLVRASLLLAIAFSLFAVATLSVRSVILFGTTGLVATVLAAASLGTLTVGTVRAYRATHQLAVLLSSTVAIVIAIALPLLLVFLLRSAWDHVLFLFFLPGGLFLGAQLALVTSNPALKGDVRRLTFAGFALLCSSGPVLSLLWFARQLDTLFVSGLVLTLFATVTNAVFRGIAPGVGSPKELS